MPELGDVEGFRRALAPFVGTAVTELRVLDAGAIRNTTPFTLEREVLGRRIEGTGRRGKWLMVCFPSRVVILHFGMTGSLLTSPPGPAPDGQDRVVFGTERGLFRFHDPRRLGGIHLADRGRVGEVLGDIGPDALGVTLALLVERLGAHRGTIKAALLDQSRLAGVGNFGSDEILWRAGIRPDAATSSLTTAEWTHLHRSSNQVLRATARAGRTPRGPSWLTGARFDPSPQCPRCGGRLEQGRVASRTTVWCPRCQPAP